MRQTIEKILIYPVKSLEGVELEEITITGSGALEHDREFALFDGEGNFVNGKNYPAINLVRAEYDLTEMYIALSRSGSSEQFIFSLLEQRDEIAEWFTGYFKKEITFEMKSESGFPDDTAAYGPTLVSGASVKEVAGWFSLSGNNVIARFRPNLVIAGTAPFWEDNLFGKNGEEKQFTVGKVLFNGINPCARCSNATINPADGAVFPEFREIFEQKRKLSLPDWAEKSRFEHYYKFCVNTKIPLSEAGKTLKAGDVVKIN